MFSVCTIAPAARTLPSNLHDHQSTLHSFTVAVDYRQFIHTLTLATSKHEGTRSRRGYRAPPPPAREPPTPGRAPPRPGAGHGAGDARASVRLRLRALRARPATDRQRAVEAGTDTVYLCHSHRIAYGQHVRGCVKRMLQVRKHSGTASGLISGTLSGHRILRSLVWRAAWGSIGIEWRPLSVAAIVATIALEIV